MRYIDAWDNQHDGECELLTDSLITLDTAIEQWVNDCHCYRRWLEGRLGEIAAKMPFFAEKWRWFLKDGETYHVHFLSECKALLPPKGAGDE